MRDTPHPRRWREDAADGALSGYLNDQLLRANVGRNHAFVEGLPVDDRAVLEGYDRAEHPWMHGRRPADVAEKVREAASNIFGF